MAETNKHRLRETNGCSGDEAKTEIGVDSVLCRASGPMKLAKSLRTLAQRKLEVGNLSIIRNLQW
jgi:hypothetical protein